MAVRFGPRSGATSSMRYSPASFFRGMGPSSMTPWRASQASRWDSSAKTSVTVTAMPLIGVLTGNLSFVDEATTLAEDEIAMYAVVRVASGRAMTKSQRRRSRSSRRSRGSRRSGRRYGNVLGVGQSFLTDHLKLHRFSDSLRITDLTNAGKRGKKVREMTVQAGTLDSTRSDAVLRRAAEHILDMDYDQAKAALTAPSKKLQVHERQLRGIDVEPGATTFKLSKTFPNGTIVSIKSSPHAFQIRHSAVISAPGKVAHGFRQDTLYWSRRKKDGQLFYDWLKTHLHAAGQMSLADLRQLWDELGVQYESH